jgi:hypothetical protein
MRFRRLIYIQVHPGHFIARLHGDGGSIRRECSGLTHPRTLAGDFFAIQKSLKEIVRELSTPWMRFVRPHALVHLIPSFEGGYTKY